MTFTNVPPVLGEALAARGYVELTPVQASVLREEAVGRDMIVSAQTGSGKTVAFGLAMAAELLGDRDRVMPVRSPQVLIVAPTREAAEQ